MFCSYHHCSSFTELLRNSLQLRGFYQYLISKGNGAEVPLVFWLAVEDMKDTLHHDDEKQQAVKIRRIKRRFFTDAAAELSEFRQRDSYS